mmetsp:Transcript_59243/g.139672  ORF Transcript_59243/g.139672 Transcript_59243/m.139672 type:complete len:221 (-) Transcript_59243:144-806(-)
MRRPFGGPHEPDPARPRHPAQAQGHLAADRAGGRDDAVPVSRLAAPAGGGAGGGGLCGHVGAGAGRLRLQLPRSVVQRPGAHGGGLCAVAGHGLPAVAAGQRAGAELRRHARPARGAQAGGLWQHGRLSGRRVPVAALAERAGPALRAVFDLPDLPRAAGADAQPAGQVRRLHRGHRRRGRGGRAGRGRGEQRAARRLARPGRLGPWAPRRLGDAARPRR